MGSSRVFFAALGLLQLVGLGTPAKAGAERSGRVVVVELFTSQGCSSCPPADRVLRRLGREVRSDGILVVPLSFHVDYWNRIGWVDPFSSPRWSARQRRYADAFGLRSVYTPQMVLNGRAELVGSRESELQRRIPTAIGERSAGRIEILGARLDDAATELVVELTAELGARQSAAPMVANLALYESGLVTRVASGENARRTLENDYVVRWLRPAIVFEAAAEAARRERLRIPLDASWVVENLGLVAFLQDAESLEIQAGTVLERLAPAELAERAGEKDRL